MGRLVVVVTSPRLPAGLLTPTAWRAVESADLVAAGDTTTGLAAALVAAGFEVVALPDAEIGGLLALAARQTVVWLPSDDAANPFAQQLAAAVVRRTEQVDRPMDSIDPEVEIVIGSFDPVGARLLDAVAVMDTLRTECPWDSQQTHETLVPYLIEEAYEVLEAIETGDPNHLREELGDLLLQVLFHARLAADDSDDPFSIDDVAAGLVDKLVRRHPHVFADVEVDGADEVAANWDEIKRTEKARDSVLSGIPSGLPALSLADSVIGRAARTSTTLSVPVPEGETAYSEETLGEVLFALVAAAHAGGLDAERALRSRVRAEMVAIKETEQRALPPIEQARH